MDDLPHYLETRKAPRFSFSPDSEFPVCIGEKGIAQLLFDLGVADGGLVSIRGGIVTNSVADHAEAAFLPEKYPALIALKLPEGISLSANSNGEPVLTALGKSAHAAMPKNSINAILKLAQFILDSNLLDDDSNSKKALTFLTAALADNYGTGLGMAVADEITGNLTCICGLAKTVDGHLQFDCNIRYPSSFDFADLFANAQAITEKAGFGVTLTSDSKGYVFEPDRAEIRALTAAVSEVLGKESKPYTMGGGTYARAFPNTVAFGAALSSVSDILGEGRGEAHDRDEAVRISDFNTAIEIFIRAFANLAGL
jgi:succinyl-diaminopimelate desuccinylase